VRDAVGGAGPSIARSPRVPPNERLREMDPESPADNPDSPEAGWIDRYEVGPHQDGWRLDRVLTERIRRASRSQVASIIRGGVRIEDGRRAKPATRMRPGDVVLVPRIERADPATPALDRIRVIDTSDDWIVIDKPAGLLVHRTAHEATRTVEAWLALRWPNERIEPVHRLDRDTSGCLVCGRGLDAIRALRAAFAEGRVDKRYRARVVDPGQRWGVGETRTLDTPLGFDAESEVRLRMGAGDLPCATHVTGRGRDGGHAILDVRIDGGRQHQIRAHLSLFGTPIVGDKLYGMGDAFFLAWLDAPGDLALVEQLDTRWHALTAVEVAVDVPGLARIAARVDKNDRSM